MLKSPFVAHGLRAALHFGGALPALLVAFLIGGALVPPHSPLSAPTQLVVALGIFFLAGGLWGRSLARRFGWARPRLALVATGATLSLGLMLAVIGLGLLEPPMVERGQTAGLPLHVAFAFVFSAAAFLVSAVLGLVLGLVAGSWRLALKLALRAGLAAGLAFLAADFAQDLLGRRVGGPRAEETATMLSVAVIGAFVAAFAGGGAIGHILTVERDPGLAAGERLDLAEPNPS